MAKDKFKIAFLALGEAHQLFHILGPAAALARGGHDVTLLVSTVWHERIVTTHAPEAGLKVRRLRPMSGRETPIHKAPPRLLTLLLNISRFSEYDVILTPECSTTLLKRLGIYRGKLAHIPHGAGDREVASDPRIQHFDFVIVAGEKARKRMIERGVTREEACIVGGYPKFDLISDVPTRFFDNDNPVILYNPHFDKHLSSWPAMGTGLVEAFAAERRFNYIIAPHIRIRGNMRRDFESCAARNTHDHIRFDSGSVHAINMDYTRAASLYVGDVSSQVYEFIATPRPCVFLNPGHVNWKGDEHYTHWRYGPVATTVDETMTYIRHAVEAPGDYIAAQREGYQVSITRSERTASQDIADALVRQIEIWRT